MNIKTYILASLLLFTGLNHLQAQASTQAAISPTGSCRVFLNASYIPNDWQQIAECPSQKIVTTTKRTTKRLPNYLKKFYSQTPTKKNKRNKVTQKKQKLARPRTIAQTKNYAQYTSRRALPNYRSRFSKRPQIQTGINKSNTNRNTTILPFRRFRISASNATKQKNTGILKANSWNKNRKNRRRIINVSSRSQYWRSINSLQSDTIKASKPVKKMVRAKLKRRYVGAPRIGSLDNVSTDN